MISMANYIGYIYKITNNINGKSYIGKTNNIERRWKEHKSGNGGTAILDKAFNKYGIQNFTFSVIQSITGSNIETFNKELSDLEIMYISTYNTYIDGYNATIGGEGISEYRHSDETKSKISKALQGRTLTEEHKQKCGTAMLGKHHTPEARLRIREALLNRNPEIIKRAADKRRGRKRSADAIEKTAASKRIPVLQYSLDGVFIAEYPSLSSIEGMISANIAACCKHRINSAYGYIWRYKVSPDFPTKINAAENYHVSNRNIIQYTIERVKIAEYNSATEASRITNIKRTAISNCLCGRSKSAGGYLWSYK